MGVHLLRVFADDDFDLVLRVAGAHQHGEIALGVADGGELLIDDEEDGGRDLAGAGDDFVVDVLAGVDDGAVVFLD